MDILGKIRGLSLFTGIGGIDIALSDYVQSAAYCEIDRYCQGILLSRMAGGDIGNAPIWDDVKTLRGDDFKGHIDIIFGGFPCQDISLAGAGKGLAGERSGLFFEIVRLAKEIQPAFLFLENVPAITTRGGLEVVREIASLGYDCRWCTISAASVGALHKRERWFLLARSRDGKDGTLYTNTNGKQPSEESESEGCSQKQPKTTGFCDDVANSNGERCDEEQGGEPVGLQKENAEFTDGCSKNDGHSMRKPGEQTYQGAEPIATERRAWGGLAGKYWPFESREHWQETVSRICRTSDGVPFHVERLRSLGNAVVPQQTKKAFEILMGFDGL